MKLWEIKIPGEGRRAHAETILEMCMNKTKEHTRW